MKDETRENDKKTTICVEKEWLPWEGFFSFLGGDAAATGFGRLVALCFLFPDLAKPSGSGGSHVLFVEGQEPPLPEGFAKSGNKKRRAAKRPNPVAAAASPPKKLKKPSQWSHSFSTQIVVFCHFPRVLSFSLTYCFIYSFSHFIWSLSPHNMKTILELKLSLEGKFVDNVPYVFQTKNLT